MSESSAHEAPRCPLCDGVLKVQDNLSGGLISVNVEGHAKAAHRTCPSSAHERNKP